MVRTRAGRRSAAFIAIAIVAIAGLVLYGFGGKPGGGGGNSTIVIVAEATTPPLDPHRMTGTIGLRTYIDTKASNTPIRLSFDDYSVTTSL